MSAIRLLRRVCAAALALLALSLPAPAQYSDCGKLVQGVTCPVLFEDSQGRLWLLDNYGSFQVGDVVLVTGQPDPACINICQQGNGCIYGVSISSCSSDPTTPYCFCPSAPCANPDPAAGCANTTGVGAKLEGSGSVSVSADDLILTTTQLPPDKAAIVFMGPTQIQIPFNSGLLCVGAGSTGLFRYPVRNSGASGTFQEGPIVGYANANFPSAGQIQAGSTWNFQVWYRDPGGACGATTNLANATSAAFVP